jgi:hypothetical protein
MLQGVHGSSAALALNGHQGSIDPLLHWRATLQGVHGSFAALPGNAAEDLAVLRSATG